MMNWRKVVCVLCAGLLCTGLVLANGPAKANFKPQAGIKAAAPQHSTASAAVHAQGTVAVPQGKTGSVVSKDGPKVASPTQLPAGVHARPASAERFCVNYLFDNCYWTTGYYFAPGIYDGTYNAIGGWAQPYTGTSVSCYGIGVYAPNGCNMYSYLAPHEGQAAYTGTEFTTAVPAGGWIYTFDLPAAVDISAALASYGNVFVYMTFDAADAGPLIGGQATLGYAPNVFWWHIASGDYWWFGGTPYAAMALQLYGPEETGAPGACCDQGVCLETDDYGTCIWTLGLRFWFPGQTCPEFTGCPQLGACCVAGTCVGTMYETDCALQSGLWFTGEDCNAGYVCPAGPANDNCADVAPTFIAADSSFTFTGNNIGATPDCGLLGWAEVWIVFQIDTTQNVRVDFCGSPLYLSTIGIWMMLDCPCSTYDPADYWNWDCTDGNAHIDWFSMPPGTYYYPMYSVPPQQGDWVCTVTTTTPPPPPPNDNCADVVPVNIPLDSSYSWTGDNCGATADCPLLGWPEVWFAFTIDAAASIRVDFCGSPTYQGTIGIVIVPDCPCSTYLYYTFYNWDCPDGNPHIDFGTLAAGTYYYPMYSLPSNCGPYQVTVTATTPPPPPPNDNCGDVVPFALVPGSPVTLTGDNTGATADCLLLGWPEVWFAFTLDNTYTVKIDYCGSPTYQGTIGIAMVPDCPCSSWFGAGFYAWDCPDGNPHLEFYNMAAGTYWYPMYSVGSTGPYQITFTALAPCDVTCPPGSVPEAEICGDLYPNGTNGGCNSTPPAFEPIALPSTICGTVWADNSYRDTDWFELVLTEPTALVWTVVGEGPMQALVFDGTLGCSNYPLLGAATAPPCGEAKIKTAPLPPGTYWFWAGLSTWGNFPCDIVYYGDLQVFVGYCDAGAYTCDEYISQVDLDTFSNPTGCGLGSGGVPGYSDYTGMTITLTAGTTYTLTVTNGNPIWTADTCGAWVDWDNNFSFADAGEFYDMGTGVGPYSTSITVPAVSGDFRLRIRVDYVNAPNPCGISSYGEVEDYTIHVGGGFAKGDVNCDGLVNAFDIDPFVKCLTTGIPTPPCPDCSTADVNGDGVVNAFDIDPFVQCIIGGGCP